MVVLRTSDAAFRALADFPFAPHYVDVTIADAPSLRMHYIDEGPRDAPAVLMLHGEPTWSYLYRHVIAACSAAGVRAIAPDLVGFGRSDKPAGRSDYTYQRHVDWIADAMQRLELTRPILLCHDWGGLIGLRLVAEHPERFSGVLAMNTSLPTGDRPAPAAMLEWQRFAEYSAEFAPGRLIERTCVRPLRVGALTAYDAPFPDDTYKAGARRFPGLVPTTPDDPASAANRRAWTSLATFTKPFLTVFGEQDPYTAGVQRAFQRKIAGAAGQPHVTLPHAGHFVCEDAADEVARLVIAFVRSTCG